MGITKKEIRIPIIINAKQIFKKRPPIIFYFNVNTYFFMIYLAVYFL